MEMKLNGQRIRTLRLQKSWTQEKLADAASLNQRTVQRVEAEGTGSLRTRKALALALDVDPASLDALSFEQSLDDHPAHVARAGSTLLQKCQGYLASRNSYRFILLMLLAAFYIASKPFFFSLSRVSFSWINFMLGRPLIEIPLWWASVIIFWLLFALPWLAIVVKKYSQYLSWHITTMISLLLLSIARLWQPTLIMETVTFCLYYSTLLLLAFQFLDHAKEKIIRQTVILFLTSYIFFWFFQSLSHQFLLMTNGYFRWGREFPEWSYIAGYTLHRLANLVQLLPVTMVLLFSMGKNRGPGVTGAHSHLLEKWEVSEKEQDQNSFFLLTRKLLKYCKYQFTRCLPKLFSLLLVDSRPLKTSHSKYLNVGKSTA